MWLIGFILSGWFVVGEWDITGWDCFSEPPVWYYGWYNASTKPLVQPCLECLPFIWHIIQYSSYYALHMCGYRQLKSECWHAKSLKIFCHTLCAWEFNWALIVPIMFQALLLCKFAWAKQHYMYVCMQGFLWDY